MLTLYFCLDGARPIMRCWSSVPRIGETVALPELGGNLNPLRVYDVIWEGTVEASVSVYVHHANVEHAICYTPSHSMGHNDGVLSELLR
jgi:hypothetical protein